MILARAGGGQNFGGFGGGGGGGGFGGGGGISGGGHGFGFPIFFGGGFGGGGSILALVVIVGLIVLVGAAAARRRGQPLEPPMDDEGLSGRPAWPLPGQSGDDGATGGSAPGAGSDATAGVAAIQQHDPAFNEAAFLASAERAFFLVQKAWTEQKPELSRQVMADGVWQQHKSQIEGQEAAGTRNLLDGLAVGSADFLSAGSDQSYDTVTVRFLAASADYDVNPSGKVVRGDRQIRQWTEDWIFQRSSSATTRTGGGTLDSKCPNCGAPLDLDLGGVCQYCHVPVMSGRYDWVLSRIEQVRGTYGLGA